MSVHSDSAKRATRKEIDGWIKTIEDNIKSLKDEKTKIQKLIARMGGTPQARMQPALDNIDKTIRNREKQLKYYKDLKQEYEKDGLI